MSNNAIEPPYWTPLALGRLTLQVASDYLMSAANRIRICTVPAVAQRFADQFDAMLPTPQLVDIIHGRADVKLHMHGLSPNPHETRGAERLCTLSNYLINADIAKATGLAVEDLIHFTGLVTGHKKDIVIGKKLGINPKAVVIYGGWGERGVVQPYFAGHGDFYYDYSHGIRLVQKTCMLDGKPARLDEVLQGPDAHLVSSEGPLSPQDIRYHL